MSGDLGGALVLLLIVTNFQRGSSNGITAKFVMLLIFLFDEYERLLATDLCPSESWSR
jgi:hypothetical protein